MTLNPVLLDYFDHPRGAGAFAAAEPGVAGGEAGSTAQGARVRFQLKIGPGGRIEAARFKAWGCSATIACASRVAEWLPGRDVEEAYNADVRRIVAALEVPVERTYALLVVEDAIKAALEISG